MSDETQIHPAQRDVMRKLVAELGADEQRVCAAYADMEARQMVPRRSNRHDWTPERYAAALWHDGVRKGWLQA